MSDEMYDATARWVDMLTRGVVFIHDDRRVDPRTVLPAPIKPVVAFEDIPEGAPISIDFTLGLASRVRGDDGEPVD